MVARAEVEELARLRRAAYGPDANRLDVESLDRLAELEAAARGGVLASDVTSASPLETEAMVPVEFGGTETSARGDAGRQRRLWAWLIPVMVVGSFAVGVVVGGQPQWLTAVIPSPQIGAASSLSTEQTQSYDRVAATQQWDDPKQVGLVSTFDQVNAWAGFMREGADYCLAIDEISATTLLCQPAVDPDAYPLEFDWVSSAAGFSLHHKVDADGEKSTTATAL